MLPLPDAGDKPLQQKDDMRDVYILTRFLAPIGRYGGVLSSVRAADLGAIPIRALMQRKPGVDWSKVDEVRYGCANQAGEDK